MVKKLGLLSLAILTVVLLVFGCSSTKAATSTISTTPPTLTTTQPPLATTSVAPTTSILPSTTAATTQPATSTPPTTTAPATSTAPATTKPVYTIHGTLGGVDDMYATIKVGTTVQWTPVGHEGDRTLVSEIPGLFGGLLTPAPNYYQYTFKEVGTFWYGFTEVPGFRASITVTP